jgi:hypothetical protein
VLFLQISVDRQTVLQPPQWLWSVDVSTQSGGVPHIDCVGRFPQGTHVPPTQLAVAPQTVPHAPQLFPSLLRSVQAASAPVPQISWLVGQTHALFTHEEPMGHTAPHAPQLFWSLIV